MIETPRIALARIDDLLNKVFVLGVALLTIDVVQNAIRQVKLLNPFWFGITLGALLVSIIGAIGAAFIWGNTRYWYRAIVLVTLATMLTWHFQMQDVKSIGVDYKPWIWWALGYATLAAFGAWDKKYAYLALIIAPAVWLSVETSVEGGGSPLGLAIQDSLYSFFFSTGLAIMVLVLRDRATRVDEENGKALEAALERVRIEVLNKERAIYNSIMHDQVLETLELASEATSAKERKNAAALAEAAIGRLNREVERGHNPPIGLILNDYVGPLTELLTRQSPDFVVSTSGSSELRLPFEIAAAIAEATILAMKNSMTHAPNASERKVKITLRAKGIKVVVSDNGGGFRMSNVHKTALGVRWTMFKRLESVGVKPSLQSTLGKGTTWIFEWQS